MSASVINSLASANQSLFEAKAAKGLTFDQIAKDLGRNEVYVAAVFYGQAKPTKEDLEGLSKCLGVDHNSLVSTMGEHFYPERGLGVTPPTDALLYRLYEIILVYGYPLKSVIHEKFGDGIMSAIDFRANVEKVNEEGADRVKLTFVGKWLPYKKW
ncbi:cyanate hydratase [Microbotryum lychnidis-dioicae p1A1 Lamole]|uniref:Cyanate hydratase n=1 Tax=Microbotryum lychnidis-dioicae (strain p1A1 Lamole / MvSl-1064) TaxID=683840 RepID=U5H5C1_USTV1|nr:cyanate hydratase [Microbotryum lychnidis-dioicae p1A1 Lamole]|eukprot:KDE07276.1 cyanate hydratase [Microbotryum lychnidis-dioicae p1A1 Lamole]